MISFSSIEFIFRFLVIFLGVYYLTPAKCKNFILLLGSVILYSVGQPAYMLLMLASIAVNYVLACKMTESKRRKLYLQIALIFDVSMLFVFKYLGFFIENINGIFGYEVFPIVKLALPLGISFYTFQMISYIVDVYRGKFIAESNIISFATYIMMFPQFLQGPIVYFDEVKGELASRKVRFKDLEAGAVAFILGLSYKVILADRIHMLWNDVQTKGVLGINTPIAWLGAWSYSFELFFDFAGYSMMAIGLGRILGFYLPMNFLDPYTSKSATEFWRNWHVTLGRWFKNYVYIPLGGNRKGKARMVFNLFVTWALTGLWHGASWNFVAWGLMLFVILMIEKLFLLKYLEKSKIIGHIYMLILIPISWMVFAISDIKNVFMYIERMLFIPIKGTVAIDGTKMFTEYIQTYWWVFVLCIVCSTSIPMKLIDKFYDKLIMKLTLVVLFWICVYLLLTSSSNPFLYATF